MILERKLLGFFLLVFMVAGSVFRSGAAEGYRSMVISTTDGKKVGLNIYAGMACQPSSDYSSLCFGEFKWVEEAGNIVYDYEISADKIAGITMSTETVGVDAPHIDMVLTPKMKEGTLLLEGVTEPTAVYVYSLNGTLLESIKVDSSAEVNLKRYGTGVYLVKIGEMTYKMFVK